MIPQRWPADGFKTTRAFGKRGYQMQPSASYNSASTTRSRRRLFLCRDLHVLWQRCRRFPPTGAPGGTAEPLDKNRLRIFQPTLGFLSAKGGKYGDHERGYPQVLKGLVLKGFRKVLVGKAFSAPKVFAGAAIQNRAKGQRPEFSACRGLTRASGGGRKKPFQVPKSYFSFCDLGP